LKLFHEEHFPGAPLPAAFMADMVADAHAYNQEDGEDDDLGYYADGVKRTLTDEQIAMFRHSEIQELINQTRTIQEAKCRELSPTNFDLELAAAINAGSISTPNVSPALVHHLRRMNDEGEQTSTW
jgi:hypothetical protein